MGDAIAVRAGSSALVYSLDIASPTPLNYEYGSNLTTSTNAEIVIKLYWDKWANPCNPPYVTTASIAATVVPFLLTSDLPAANGGPIISRPLVEMPLHLIGHSRGGSVVLEIAHMLAQRGVWVDQLTTLDPHPITNSDLDALCLLHLGISPDPVVQLYDNVVFADEYYQFDNDGLAGISGVPIPGATQQFLNDRLASDGLPEGLANDHQEVHNWYHGTIDTNATTVGGDAIPRTVWYVPGDIGFRFSLIAEAETLRKQIQPAYTGSGLKWSGATRSSAYTRTSLQWPNIELENISNVWTVVQGTTVPILLRFQNSFSNYVVTINLGEDNDQNPYNNSAGSIISTSIFSVDSSSVYAVNPVWSPTIVDNGKYLYAKITDYKGFVRFYYLSRPFYVFPPPPPRFTSITRSISGAVRLTFSCTVGNNYTVQAASDFGGWVTITNFFASSTTFGMSDSTPPSLTRRFYRAISH